MITIPEFVNKVMGMTFADRERCYARGDCWTAVWLFYRDVLGIDLPAYDTQYGDAGETPADRKRISALMVREKKKWRKVDDHRVGDVVLLRCGGRNCHVGVVIEKGLFLHIDKPRGAMIERLDSPVWARRREGIYRLA